VSSDAARGMARFTSIKDRRIRQRMSDIRTAQRLRRLARDQVLMYAFYDEHNLFAEAIGARRAMMQMLRAARGSWRRALGLPR